MYFGTSVITKSRDWQENRSMQETEATGLGERWSLLSRAFFFCFCLFALQDCEACEDQLTTHDTSVVACGHLVNNQTSLVQSASSESHEDSRFKIQAEIHEGDSSLQAVTSVSPVGGPQLDVSESLRMKVLKPQRDEPKIRVYLGISRMVHTGWCGELECRARVGGGDVEKWSLIKTIS